MSDQIELIFQLDNVNYKTNQLSEFSFFQNFNYNSGIYLGNSTFEQLKANLYFLDFKTEFGNLKIGKFLMLKNF